MRRNPWLTKPFIVRTAAAIFALLAVIVLAPYEARAEDDAKAILKKMSDYIAEPQSGTRAIDNDV